MFLSPCVTLREHGNQYNGRVTVVKNFEREAYSVRGHRPFDKSNMAYSPKGPDIQPVKRGIQCHFRECGWRCLRVT